MDGTFGPYRLLGLLGSGGMGEVHRAWDAEHERVVALKLLSPHLATDPGYRARFAREARLSARLRGPHVVPIHRYGEIDGRLFLDMRLLEGEDLAGRLARTGPLPLPVALAVAEQVAEALDAAHADGLVHRDVKPSNVLLTGRPDAPFVYLVDFGIARSSAEGPAAGPAITQTGTAIGSFEYMAPERFVTGHDVDPRVDVYALACVLYECLTGVRAFACPTLPAAYHAHLHTEPAPLWARRADVPPALDGVLRRALAKDPARRTPTAGQLAAEARQAVAARPAGTASIAPAVPPAVAPARNRPLSPAGLGAPPLPSAFPPAGPRRPGPPPAAPPPAWRPVPADHRGPAVAPWSVAPPPGSPPGFPPNPPPGAPPGAAARPAVARRPVLAAVVAAAFVVLVALIDRADAEFPLGIGVALGLTAMAGQVLLALTLGLRDAIDEAGGLLWALGVVAAGAWVVAHAAPAGAAVPVGAFVAAQLADLGMWRLVRPGLGWRAGLVASNLVGAVAYTTVQVAAGQTGEVGGLFLVTAATTVASWAAAEVLRPLLGQTPRTR